jgi:SAM-dependent methyltransferase
MAENQQYWLNDALGEYLKSEEQALFDAAVADLFGFKALQYGILELDLLRESRIPYLLKADISSGNFQAESPFLPLPASSLDLLLLPHALDFSDFPQQTLREAERVLVPEGHVVLTGVNPLSLWGLRRFFQRKPTCSSEQNLWVGQSFGALRIKDWLNLLGFEIVSTHFSCYRIPMQNQSWSKRLALDVLGRKCWSHFGGVYCIVAKKRVLGMRVIKPNWNKVKLNSKFVTTTSQKDELRK